jgi:hypothetical protein
MNDASELPGDTRHMALCPVTAKRLSAFRQQTDDTRTVGSYDGDYERYVH